MIDTPRALLYKVAPIKRSQAFLRTSQLHGERLSIEFLAEGFVHGNEYNQQP
jgi:hypothetical protein